MLAHFKPGAPGVFELPPEPVRALTGERMDVCAFLGVAPRGPCHAPAFVASWAPVPPRGGRTRRSVPAAVESWSAYQELFGAFEGPGLLPYAVASFFENGGRRAWIVRVVPERAGTVPGVARAPLVGLRRAGGGGVMLRARSEGAWGNQLSATLRWRRRAVQMEPAGSSLTELLVARDADLHAGSLLWMMQGGAAPVLRLVSRLREEWDPESGVRRRFAILAAPLAVQAERAELVEGELTVQERGAPGRTEVHGGLGLGAEHPRFLGRVLVEASRLLYPDERPGLDWTASDLEVGPALADVSTPEFSGGEDRFSEIAPGHFFSDWLPGDEEPGDGVHALADVPDVALVCAPDLYAPFALPLPEPTDIVDSLAGPDFSPCVPLPRTPPPPPPPDELAGLRLDPRMELDAILGLQERLVLFAEQLQQFVVLLDVPPGLEARRMDRWRARFDSAYAAAYHPWLWVSRGEDARGRRMPVPPSAVAAGITAERELAEGLSHGPANAIARGVVDVLERVSPARHDALHPQGFNVYLWERDGARLTAARTLSRQPEWRQLSVRRLVTMLRRVLARQMLWMVFEPNGRSLRTDVVTVLSAYLRQLHRANAFAGRTEAEGFFVRCDDSLNPPWSVASGRLLVEVGVAPVEPLEFIVLRIEREGDGTLRVEDGHG
jgi:hypothetical protein